jgi:hypothetical protein
LETDDGEPPVDSALVAQIESQLAGPRYRVVLPRLNWPVDFLFQDLLYEIPNERMRRVDAEEGQLTGAQIAQQWRRTIEMTRGAFILRDSLFSQQDHPYRVAPYAIMLPPSWIVAAVADVSAQVPLRPMCTPPVDDDAAWEQIRDAHVMFGSFPSSLTLFRVALGRSIRDRSPTALQIRNARLTLRALARESAALLEAAPQGADAVARAGASRVSANDIRYFGRDLRRARVIPIIVENPNPHERREGKGLVPMDRSHVPPTVIHLVRDQLLASRLRDGDIAIERYDLSSPAERDRVTQLLRHLIPVGSPSAGKVWLWMAGASMSPDGGCDNRVLEQTQSFLVDLESAGVDRSRLRLVRKPDLTLGRRAEAHDAFEAATARCEVADILLPVNLGARELRTLMGVSDAQPPVD